MFRKGINHYSGLYLFLLTQLNSNLNMIYIILEQIPNFFITDICHRINDAMFIISPTQLVYDI